jgi:hypothetical protein
MLLLQLLLLLPAATYHTAVTVPVAADATCSN